MGKGEEKREEEGRLWRRRERSEVKKKRKKRMEEERQKAEGGTDRGREMLEEDGVGGREGTEGEMGREEEQGG